MYDLLTKELEIIELLVKFSKKLLELLAQHTDVSEYEHELGVITAGEDVII